MGEQIEILAYSCISLSGHPTVQIWGDWEGDWKGNAMASSPSICKGQGRVGGRFSVLANDEADHEADVDDVHLPEVASPSPSDLVCESVQVSYSEQQVKKCIDGLVPDTDCAWNGLGVHFEDKVEVLR
ncbi:hypothetical protein D1007_35244 [Hordeum vulgare]|nr:hypothetical protein D1007_35244 [Hordeum vulgare]